MSWPLEGCLRIHLHPDKPHSQRPDFQQKGGWSPNFPPPTQGRSARLRTSKHRLRKTMNFQDALRELVAETTKKRDNLLFIPKMNNTHSIKLSAIKLRNTKKEGNMESCPKKHREKHTKKKQITQSTSQSFSPTCTSRWATCCQSSRERCPEPMIVMSPKTEMCTKRTMQNLKLIHLPMICEII